MPSRVLREPEDADRLAKLLRSRKMPLTVTWTAGASRSGRQNRLLYLWYSDISRHMGDQTPQQVRAECKLTLGVPILRHSDEAFRAFYDGGLRGLSYEAKIAAMEFVPVSSYMTTPQMTEYLNAIDRKYSPMGVRLTDPAQIIHDEEFK